MKVMIQIKNKDNLLYELFELYKTAQKEKLYDVSYILYKSIKEIIDLRQSIKILLMRN